jgi:pimeloyl-ACP methyl ester carboxylesterase
VREEAGRFGYKFDPRWFSVPPAPRPQLESVVSPTMIVRGADSTLLTPEGADELARELPDARVAVVPDAGHNVHVERPGAFLGAIFPFLDGALAQP